MRKSIVFPGQGSQYLGMGKYLFDNFKSSKLVFEEVDCALNQKLSNIIFGEDKNILNLTENTQPAIMTVSIATFEALKEIKGIERPEDVLALLLTTSSQIKNEEIL